MNEPLTYERICANYKRTVDENISPELKQTIEDIYNGRYNLNTIPRNGEIYLWLGNYYQDMEHENNERTFYYAQQGLNSQRFCHLMSCMGRFLYYRAKYRFSSNRRKMIKYYRLAIEMDNVDAICNYCYHCLYIDMSINTDKKIIEYLQRGVEFGNAKAMCMLGDSYGYDKNKEEMKKYGIMAIANGNNEANVYLLRHYTKEEIKLCVDKYEHEENTKPIMPLLK
jgi:TPR repeat protein